MTKLLPGKVEKIPLQIWCYTEGDYSVSLKDLMSLLENLKHNGQVQLFMSDSMVRLLASKDIIHWAPIPYTAMYQLKDLGKWEMMYRQLHDLSDAQ